MHAIITFARMARNLLWRRRYENNVMRVSLFPLNLFSVYSVYVDLYVITNVWSIVYYFVQLCHVTHVATICKPDGGDWRKQFVVLQQYLRSGRYCGRDLFRLTVVFGKNNLPTLQSCVSRTLQVRIVWNCSCIVHEELKYVVMENGSVI
jgi:hypothetical protein